MSVTRPFLILVVVLTSLLASAPTAQAKLVYTCGWNICASRDDGTRPVRLTRNGTRQRPYSFPTIARNGSVIAFARGERIWLKRGARPAVDQVRSYWGVAVGFLRLNATGSTMMWNEFNYALDFSGSYGVRSYTTIVPSTVRRLPKNTTREVANAHSGFTPAGLPVAAGSFSQSACEWIRATGACGRSVAVIPEPVGDQMLSGSGDFSPNGRLYATTVLSGIGSGATSRIGIFNARTGSFQRWLTRATSDEDPVFSPDGRRIAYGCGRSICTINVNGTGRRVVVRQGSYPGWGRG